MKKLLLMSGLATAAGLMSGLAAAQEVGKVISSTPITRQVTEPRTTCTNDADGRQRCHTEKVTEQRATGYKVVYEYAGRQYTTQLDASPAPGATIDLEVTPTVRGALPASSRQPQPVYTRQPEPVYSTERTYATEPIYTEPVYTSQPQIVERVVREPVYVESVYVDRPYYPRPYYYSGYYSPFYPLAGLALGFTVGHYSRPYYHGGWHGHGGHWRR